MNSFSTQYIVNNSQQELNEKLINLQRQLIEARLQQDNLRRINKSLEETIKTATKNQMKDFNPTQRLSMNMTWKQKYQHEVQRNLESQKYIKVLEKKKSTRNTLSLAANHSNSKPKYNINNRHSSNYSTAVKSTSNHLYEPNTTKCDRNFTLFAQNTQKTHKLVRQNSISKMDNFIDRLLSKDDGRMSQIALNTRKFDINCMANDKNYSNKKMLTNKRNQDSLDKNFYSVSGLKSNRQQRTENDENAWELIDRKMALKCNLDMYNKKNTFNTEHDKYHKTKLQLTTHYR